MYSTRYILVTFVLFLTIASLQLEAQPIGRNPAVFDLIQRVNLRHGYTPMESSVEGSPFLTNHFVVGNIYYDDKPDIHSVPIRYNIYEDQIEYYKDEMVMELLTYPIVNKVTIGDGDTTFIYEPYKEGKEEIAGYFQLLHEGEASLLLKMSVDFREEKIAKPMQNPSPAEYKRLKDQYYVKFPAELPIRIRSMKKLIAKFPDHRKELTKYYKDNNISSGNSKELITLFAYYDELHSRK